MQLAKITRKTANRYQAKNEITVKQILAKNKDKTQPELCTITQRVSEQKM